MEHLDATHSTPLFQDYIDHLQWTIMKKEHILERSAVRIENAETTYDKTGIVTNDGLVDLRLGAQGKNKCQFVGCLKDQKECPGHFGHIVLHQPMYNINFLNHVKQILECLCHSCHRICVDVDDQKYKATLGSRNAYIRLSHEAQRQKHCTHCRKPTSRVMIKRFQIRVNGNVFTANKCLALFSRITSDDLQRLGFDVGSRSCETDEIEDIHKSTGMDAKTRIPGGLIEPKDFLVEVLPVPPTCIRPGLNYKGQGRDDALTKRLQQIITHNNRVGSARNETTRNEQANVLQMHLNAYFDARAATAFSIYHKEWRSLKSLRCSLKGKTGRIRGNLMGKRVDFCARNVITGDPNIDIDEVGIPRATAANLTRPELVANFNIDKLQAMVIRSWKPKHWSFLPLEEFILDQQRELISSFPPEFNEYVGSIGHRLYDCAESLFPEGLDETWDKTMDAFIEASCNDVSEILNELPPGRNWTWQNRVANTIEFMRLVIRVEPKSQLDRYPGANFVSKNGTLLDLTYTPMCPILAIGDSVDRHLRDGDLVAMNRQPSLHRQSFLAHRVRVLPGKTFRLNVLICQGFNAGKMLKVSNQWKHFSG